MGFESFWFSNFVDRKIYCHWLWDWGNRDFIFSTSSFLLQIVNFLVLVFWNSCVLDKLPHCFQQIFNNWPFYYYFHIVYYRWINWVTWTCTYSIFPLPFDCKSSYRTTKIISIELPRPKTHNHTLAPSFLKYFIN